MTLPERNLPKVSWPARAGELQRSADVSGLGQELGENYDQYHLFLAKELSEIGGAPVPEDYRGRFTLYIETWARVQEILRAEQMLRTCRSQKAGVETDHAPLVDSDYRLFSVAAGKAVYEGPRGSAGRPPPPPLRVGLSDLK
jgi:hypothetical protein